MMLKSTYENLNASSFEEDAKELRNLMKLLYKKNVSIDFQYLVQYLGRKNGGLKFYII